MGFYSLKKTLQLFSVSLEELKSKGIAETSFPEFARSDADNRLLKSWNLQQLPSIGEKIGFLGKPSHPIAVAIFVTKGGVLKSTLTLNLARMAALHGLRVCVVGLDMQGDISASLSAEELNEESASLEEAILKMDSVHGLADVYTGNSTIQEVIRPTDLPTLFYAPETPELVALDQSLVNRNRREYWLQDHVINPLKESFDLILMDCSPNWNRLITNALISCDVLISPLECKINNFRNFKTFRALLSEFQQEMQLSFKQIYVPTKVAPNRKLSREICEWYHANLENCTKTGIRESLQGEESVALRLSIPEYSPQSQAADEIRGLLREIWNQFASVGEQPRHQNKLFSSHAVNRKLDISL